MIRGWLGWAVVGDEAYAYAKSMVEAWQRYWEKLGVASPPAPPPVVYEELDDEWADYEADVLE